MVHLCQRAARSGFFTLLLSCAAAVWLAACGGGDDGAVGYPELAEQARALRQQAVSLVQQAPCSADNQCAGLVFGFAEPTCRQHDQHTYSRLSPLMPEAERLAAEQRDTARRALAVTTFPPVVCTTQADPEPRHVCVNQRCVQQTGTVAPGALQRPGA